MYRRPVGSWVTRATRSRRSAARSRAAAWRPWWNKASPRGPHPNRPAQQFQPHRHLATGRPPALPAAYGNWGRSRLRPDFGGRSHLTLIPDAERANPHNKDIMKFAISSDIPTMFAVVLGARQQCRGISAQRKLNPYSLRSFPRHHSELP